MNSFWKQRKPRERTMIVLCLLVVAIGIPLMLLPEQKAGKKLLTPQAARHKFEGLIRQKSDLDKELQQLKPEMEAMAYHETPEELVPRVIKELQSHAKASGVHLREIKPMRPRMMASVTRVPLTVRFSTPDFGKAVMGFLYRVEDPKGRLVVEKLNVTAADQKTHTVDVEAQIALFTLAGGEAPGQGKERDG